MDAQTEKKSSKSKSKLTMDYQWNPAPPVVNKSKGKGLLDEFQYTKNKKNLFCKPEEDDDQDFNLNYQQWTPIGYDSLANGFQIPEVCNLSKPFTSKCFQIPEVSIINVRKLLNCAVDTDYSIKTTNYFRAVNTLIISNFKLLTSPKVSYRAKSQVTKTSSKLIQYSLTSGRIKQDQNLTWFT